MSVIPHSLNEHPLGTDSVPANSPPWKRQTNFSLPQKSLIGHEPGLGEAQELDPMPLDGVGLWEKVSGEICHLLQLCLEEDYGLINQPGTERTVQADGTYVKARGQNQPRDHRHGAWLESGCEAGIGCKKAARTV